MGKTALALNICEHVGRRAEDGRAVRQPGNGRARAGRAAALRPVAGRRPQAPHRARGWAPARWPCWARPTTSCASRPLFIDDTPARNMLQITANSRRLKLRQNLGLIVVDYIQLIDSEDSRDSRQEQIAKISRRLKTLARELQVPVIALSQLNRAVENREDRRPRMADLRESRRDRTGCRPRPAPAPARLLRRQRPARDRRADRRQEPQRRHRHGQADLPEELHPVREPGPGGRSLRGRAFLKMRGGTRKG